MAIDGRSAVTLSLEGPQPQRRATVAFRIILALPHLFWVAILGVASFFAVVAAWFAALFTGQVPNGIGDFVARVLQYQTGLYAYMYLLTDRYPPFTLSPVDSYPAELEIEPPDRLNRAAVLFRILLMIPAIFVSSLISGGATIALFFLWIITLISGRMPESAFEALAVTLRYQLRLYAYGSLLTSEYPGGLFGDHAELAPTTAPFEQPFSDALPPPPAPGGFAATEAPRLSRFVLSKGARRLVILFIILGVFSNAGSGVRAVDVSNRTDATKKLKSEHDQVVKAMNAYIVDLQGCATASGGQSCLSTAGSSLIVALSTFQRNLHNIDVPNSAMDDETLLDGDVTQMITLLDQEREAPTAADRIRAMGEFSAVLNSFDRDFQQLYHDALFG
jgi:hypothetical protein